MRNKVKGMIGPIEITLIVIAVVTLAFVGWRVMSAQQTDSDNDDTSEQAGDQASEVPAGWIEYSSSEFDFSLYYPSEWGSVTEDLTDNTGDEYEGIASGKFLSLLFNNYGAVFEGSVHIYAATSDYSLSKGPFPIGYLLGNGWEVAAGGDKFMLKQGDESNFLDAGNFVSLAEQTDFNEDMIYVVEEASELGSKTYSYSLNTSVGGVRIYTEDESQLELLLQLAQHLTSS